MAGAGTNETTYVVSLNEPQDPAAICFGLLAAGYDHPDLREPFSYLDLGCGYGLSMAFAAARYPAGRFLGIDFNPKHKAFSDDLTARAGLGNVEFRAQSFEAFGREGDEKFDFVALHGVFSWVSAADRAEIVKIVEKVLAPDGVVYAGYNALAGRAFMLPVRNLLSSFYKRQEGKTEARVKAALQEVNRCFELGRGNFSNAYMGNLIRSLEDKDYHYVYHEYMADEWTLFSLPEMAALLDGAGIRFAAAVDLLEAMDDLLFEAPLRAGLDGMDDVVMREAVKDCLLQKQLRKDIFLKTPRRIKTEEQRQRLKGWTLRPRVAADLISFEKSMGVGSRRVSLPRQPAAHLFKAVDGGAYDWQELEKQLPGTGGFNETLAAILRLVAFEDLFVTFTDGLEPSRCQALNAVLDRLALEGWAVPHRLAPLSGVAAVMSPPQSLFANALSTGADPLRHARAVLGEASSEELERPLAKFHQNAEPFRKIGFF